MASSLVNLQHIDLLHLPTQLNLKQVRQLKAEMFTGTLIRLVESWINKLEMALERMRCPGNDQEKDDRSTPDPY